MPSRLTPDSEDSLRHEKLAADRKASHEAGRQFARRLAELTFVLYEEQVLPFSARLDKHFGLHGVGDETGVMSLLVHVSHLLRRRQLITAEPHIGT